MYMDIVIFNKDLNYLLNQLEEISKKFKEYRVVYMSDNEEKFKDYINSNSFDVAIVEDVFLENYPELLEYNVHKICIMKNFKQSKRYIAVSKNSERALYDNLAKILTKSSITNEDIKAIIRKELEYLGYNFSLRGTKYLEDAINLIYLKNCEFNLEKEVYAQLSKTYRKAAHTIKVDIVNSTNAMIDSFGYNNILDYLGIDCNYGVGTKAIMFAILNRIKNKHE